MRNIKKPLFIILVSVICLSLFTQCRKGMNADTLACYERNIHADSLNGIRIVYINLDTVMYRYNLAIEINKEMISKEAKTSSILESKRKKIEQEVAQFEYKCNAKIFTNEESYIKERDAIMQKETEYIKLRDELFYELENENIARNKELRDSINNYIQEYNSVKGYDFILTKIGDNILFANSALDITNEIVEGLNNRYRK